MKWILLLWLLSGSAKVDCFSIGPRTNKIRHIEMSASTRRDFVQGITLASLIAVTTGTSSSPAFASNESAKVLVLGGTGLVGSEVVRQLKNLNIPVVATSRNGRDGTIPLDVTKVNVEEEVARLAQGCTSVISTLGAINTPNDLKVNAATGLAAVGAKKAGVKHFVYLSNAPEVRESVGQLEFLQGYMQGKAFSEEAIKQQNFDSYTLIKPTFIYGGDKFGINPPRVVDAYGQLVEGLLSTAPFRVAADILPGFLGLALEPPVSARDVASAAIEGAISSETMVLDTHDKIVGLAKASKRT